MPEILEKNLARLRHTEPELAARLEATEPLLLDEMASAAGPLSASIKFEGRTLCLASRYDPMAEACRLISVYDPSKHACVIVLGMGLGYHVAELVRLVNYGGNHTTIIIVFEPNLSLMRAVLQVVDHQSWLGCPNVILADARMNRAGLLGRVEPFTALLTQGTVLITHPPSRTMHGSRLSAFGDMVAEIMAFCRTNIATKLVNSARTCRNLANNVGHYAAGFSTDELHNVAAGYPAVCVGAGPSLARNIDLLRDQTYRRNLVLISAQTTLKPLLQRGVAPDFVTALDYHEISRRFYEDLAALPNVTLVAEPLANCTILDSFPGPIRLTHSDFLDKVLGDLAPGRVPIRGGATVAHLSFYLAQHLGCNPIILIGQDLAFTDGLYYCPGTAIHDVWAAELGPFNTLEMMEWQRVVRHRQHLQKQMDIHGQCIYSDEQMMTYLKQFERDFSRATQTIIDATEGGLPKQHTVRKGLADALASAATRPVPSIPLPPRRLDPSRLTAAFGQMNKRIDQVAELRNAAKTATIILRQMIEHQHDRIRMEQLFKQLEPAQEKVQQMQIVFDLVNELNAIGVFKRAQSDRAIEQVKEKFEHQRKQIERDLENLDFLIQACDEAMDIFSSSVRRVAAHLKANQTSPCAHVAAVGL